MNIQEQHTDKLIESVADKGKVKSKHSQVLLQLISDVTAVLMSFYIQYFIRFHTGWVDASIKPDVLTTIITSLVFLGYWLLVFFFAGMYKNWYEKSPFDEIFSVLKVTLVGTGILVFFIFYDSGTSPRMMFILYFAVLSVLLVTGRSITRITEKNLRAKGVIRIPILAVGTLDKVCNFYKQTKEAKNWGYHVIGIVLTNRNEYYNLDSKTDLPVLGHISDLQMILDKTRPEEVVISTNNVKSEELLDIISLSDDRSIRVKIEPDLYDIFTGQGKVQSLYGIPLIAVKTEILKPYQEAIKRVFDILFSLTVLTGGLPFWLIIGILVKLDSKGPMLFKQQRVGKDDRNFTMYKFRSMVESTVEKGAFQFTTVGDSRVTKFGRFIRKTHLDEIPQFFNVLIGDMSIVGPRPEIRHNVDKFSKTISHYKRRLKVRPGITGWWQINYGPHVLDEKEVRKRLKDDFYYIENMSISLDIEIIIRTVWCVLKGHGQA